MTHFLPSCLMDLFHSPQHFQVVLCVSRSLLLSPVNTPGAPWLWFPHLSRCTSPSQSHAQLPPHLQEHFLTSVNPIFACSLHSVHSFYLLSVLGLQACPAYLCACVLSPVQLSVSPWTVAHHAPLFMAFFRQEYWDELPFPPPGKLLDQVFCVSCIAGGFLTAEPWAKPLAACTLQLTAGVRDHTGHGDRKEGQVPALGEPSRGLSPGPIWPLDGSVLGCLAVPHFLLSLQLSI